jgi:hypothetical protein
MTEAETVTAVAELRKVAGDRPDLLAEVAGLALGTAESRGQGYMVRGQAVAELCIAAGADESMIPAWIEEGRRRAEAARHPPFSGGVRPPLGDYKGTAGGSDSRFRRHHGGQGFRAAAGNEQVTGRSSPAGQRLRRMGGWPCSRH